MPEQLWGDDAFTDGTPVYGTAPSLYTNIEPWATSPEGTTGYSLSVDDGELFDGYQFELGEPSGWAAFARRAGVGDFSCWNVERQNAITEGEVILSPALGVIGGTPDFDTFRQFGVCSHVSGGTLLTPGGDSSDEYYQSVTGWFLIEAKQPSFRHRMFLLELSGGVITVLGQEDVRVTDPAHAAGTAADFFRPTRLRLVVEDLGANRRLTAYRTTAFGPEAQLFGTTFNRPALPDGRCGFGMQTVRQSIGGCVSTGIANEFTIRDSAGAVLFNDRFGRVQRAGARRLTDGSRFGRSLAQAWIGDHKSQENNGALWLADTLIRDTITANQAATGADVPVVTTEWPGYFLRQHAPTTREQHYAATINRLAVDPSTRAEMGVLTRFTIQTFPSGVLDARGRFPTGGNEIAGYYKSGYVVYVVNDTTASPVWQLEVRHHNGSTDSAYRGDLLATADLTSAGLIVGTAFELAVEVRNFDGSQFGQGGFVALLIEINSTVITPVVATGVTGVIVTDDFLVDTRSAATVDAGGVGMYFCPDALGSGNLCAFLDFGERPLTDPPEIDPNEQAGVPIASEASSVWGDLTIDVQSNIVESIVSEPIRHEMESGKVQVIAAQPQGRRAWDVSATMERAEWESLATLFEANGAHTPFNWTHPYTGEAHVVLFAEDRVELNEEFVAGGEAIYSARFRLEEVFAQATYNPEA